MSDIPPEVQILMIKWRLATEARAEFLRGAAAEWLKESGNPRPWDRAAEEAEEKRQGLRAKIRALRYDWPDSTPTKEEWPDTIAEPASGGASDGH